MEDQVKAKLEELRTLMVFAEYTEYSGGDYGHGAGSTDYSDAKDADADSSVWTDVVSLDDSEKVEL